MMKTKLFTLFFAFLLSNVVEAQQVVSYFAEIPSSSSNWTKTIHLPGFASNLGTLTQVKLSYSGEAWQSLYAENLSENCTPYDLSTTATLALAKSGGAALFAPMPVILHRAGRLAGYDGTTDFAHSSGVQFTQDFTISGVYVDANLDAYLGGEPVNFTATASALSSLSAGGNVLAGASNSAAARLTVEYSYVPIPEPVASAVIITSAVVGSLAMSRKRMFL